MVRSGQLRITGRRRGSSVDQFIEANN